MTINEAIKHLDKQRIIARRTGQPVIYQALGLGMEALEREQANRDNPDFVMVGQLPGETEG